MIQTSKIMGNRIKQYLNSGKRFDGRDLETFRDLEVEYGVSNHAEGSVRVKLGKTEVIVGVKMDVGTPYPDSKNKGNLMTTMELLPLSSPRIELGPPKFDSIEIGRVIDRCIRESGFIDFEKLCIKEGEKVWNLYVDIYSINDDGNLLDAAGIGAVLALKNAKMPKYDEVEEKVIYDESSGKSLALSKDTPMSITVYRVGEQLIIDPTKEEEDLFDSKLTLGGKKGVISSMQKGNEKSLSIEEFNKCLDLAEKAKEDLLKRIEKLK